MWKINFPYKKDQWYGKLMIEFPFEDRTAWVVFPDEDKATDRIAMKMEYWGAFPKTEQCLVDEGYFLAYLTNRNRWGQDVDHDAKVRFLKFMHEQFGTREKMVCVGMSCGGFHSVNFASRHPECVSALYLDAPLLNMLSYPMGYGVGTQHMYVFDEEIAPAYGFSKSDLLSYRDEPMDRIPVLVANRIPVAMTAGDSDQIVPYVENGILLEQAYRDAGVPLYLHIEPGRDHHPHGLEDPTPVLEFIRKYAL